MISVSRAHATACSRIFKKVDTTGSSFT